MTLTDGARARRVAVRALIASLLMLGAAHAETFVLVYSEGSIISLPGGAVVTKGQQIDGDKLVLLGPADYAIFVSQAGNVVHRDGPYCGTVVAMEGHDEKGGMFGMFGGKSAAPAPQGCPK
ncbi:MAG TPA: hypothetical protein VMU22_09760 [Rhizomicrobium sp.]|nr:hypothetical protein [Rhizomicrobium sp.]